MTKIDRQQRQGMTHMKDIVYGIMKWSAWVDNCYSKDRTCLLGWSNPIMKGGKD